ncbi:hypothetical protein MRX96_044909 [Rhipicephalus microplus]
MLLRGTFLVTLLGCCAALGVVLTTYEEDNLVVDIVNAPANSIMFLVRLPSDGTGCMDTEAATVEQELVIQSANVTASYSRHLLGPGRYCALPRRNLHESGVLDIDAINGTTFYRNFRFHKGDLDDLIVGLLIPGKVMSAQRV